MEGSPHLAAVPPYGGFFPPLRTIDQVGTASVGAGADVEILRYAIPVRARGVIWGFGQSVLDTDAWASLTWRLTVDGSTVENCLWTTRVGLMVAPTKVYVPLGPNQTIRVQVLNAAGGAFTACARICGNFWPIDVNGLGTPEEMTFRGVHGLDRPPGGGPR